jgi:hypothetical protein
MQCWRRDIAMIMAVSDCQKAKDGARASARFNVEKIRMTMLHKVATMQSGRFSPCQLHPNFRKRGLNRAENLVQYPDTIQSVLLLIHPPLFSQDSYDFPLRLPYRSNNSLLNSVSPRRHPSPDFLTFGG